MDMLEIVSRKAENRKLDDHQVAIIAGMTEACCDLITAHFKGIDSCRKENKTCSAQVALGFTIGYDGGNAVVNTTISFSKKFKDGREDHISDPKQKRLLGNQNEPFPDDESETVVKPKAKKGKK